MENVKMRNIIDTWRLIDKYNLEGCMMLDCITVLVPKVEYQRLMNSVLNKQYVKNITQ